MLNAPRSTLSVFTTVERYDVGKHPLVCHYMKALCYLKLTLHNYSFTWDVSIVLKYLSTLTNDSVFHLSAKLATLLPVLCGQKTREILAITDSTNISFDEDLLVIRVRDALKITTRKFHLEEFKFPAYHEKCIYLVETMMQYMKDTEEITRLFITSAKPYTKAYRDTLSR